LRRWSQRAGLRRELSRTAEGLLVQDILHICLDEGERLRPEAQPEGFLHFPCPEGWTEGLVPCSSIAWNLFPCSIYYTGLAAFAPSFGWVTATTEDVADGVGGDLQSSPLEVKGKPLPAVACSLAGLPNTFLYLRRGLAGGVVGPAGTVLEPLLSLCLEATHPLAYHRSAELATKPDGRCTIGGPREINQNI